MTYQLIPTPNHLTLQSNEPLKKPFYIDFLSKKMHYRLSQLSFKKEALGRAMGKKPSDHPKIIDATAGFGTDSFILAALGFEMILLERSPVIYALLADAIHRATEDAKIGLIAARLKLLQTEASCFLSGLSAVELPEIIYLDPMFPVRKKSAQTKREMQILHELLPPQVDQATLLEIAIACATYRVVVKRPRLAPNLADRKPHFCIPGKVSRLDIYLTGK